MCGDAGFLMNVQEMETARRLGSELTVLIWEDNEYGLIAWKQENEFGHHTDLSFGNPKWLKLADAFGWNGYYCANSGDLKDVLTQSFRDPGPSLVVIPSTTGKTASSPKNSAKSPRPCRGHPCGVPQTPLWCPVPVDPPLDSGDQGGRPRALTGALGSPLRASPKRKQRRGHPCGVPW